MPYGLAWNKANSFSGSTFDSTHAVVHVHLKQDVLELETSSLGLATIDRDIPARSCSSSRRPSAVITQVYMSR